MVSATRPSAVSVLVILRAVAGLSAGFVGVVAPDVVLRLLVYGGGLLLLVDGVLSLAGLDFRGPRAWPFRLGVIRSFLAVIAGLLILFSSALASLVPMPTIILLVGLQAVVVGAAEIALSFRRLGDRSFWMPFAAGAVYLGLGLLLLFVPLAEARLLIQVGGVILIAHAAILFLRVWEGMRLTGR